MTEKISIQIKSAVNSLTNFVAHHNITAILLSGIAVYIPFICKPFHMDDPFFIYAARAIDMAPFHPFSVHSFYNLWGSNFNSILFYYFTATLRAIIGENEIGMHCGYLVFFIGAGVILYLLCRSMKIHSIIPALLLLFSPLSMLTSSGIMSDFPFVFFLLSAVYCFVKGMEQNDDPLLIAVSMLAILCAIFTKYYGLLIIIPLAFLAVAHRKYKYLLYFLTLLICFALSAVAFSHGSESHFMYVIRQLGWMHSPIRKETLSFLTTLGGVTVFPLSYLALIGNRPKRWIVYIGAFMLVEFALFYVRWHTFAVHTASLYLVNSCILFTFVIERTLRSLRKKEYIVSAMGLWFLSYSIFIMTLPSMMAARYVLPMLPPLVIFFFLEADAQLPSGVKRLFLKATLMLTVVLGFALNIADYKLANIYRKFAREIKTNLSQTNTGFLGDYAFAYYLQKNGFVRYDPSQHNFLLIAKYASSHEIFGRNEALMEMADKYTLVATIPASTNPVLRVWDPSAFAGFHLNMFGYIPWGISDQPMDTFYLFRRK